MIAAFLFASQAAPAISRACRFTRSATPVDVFDFCGGGGDDDEASFNFYLFYFAMAFATLAYCRDGDDASTVALIAMFRAVTILAILRFRWSVSPLSSRRARGRRISIFDAAMISRADAAGIEADALIMIIVE